MKEDGASVVVVKLADWVSAITAITVIALVCGHVERGQYLRSLGAGWSVGLLSTSDYVMWGSVQVVFIAVAAVVYLQKYSRRAPERQGKGKRKLGVMLAMVVCLGTIAPYFFRKWIGEVLNPDFFVLMAAITSGLATSFGVFAIVTAVAESKSERRGFHVLETAALLVGLFSTLVYAPTLSGMGQAWRDGGPNTRLPTAVLSGEHSRADWVLVTTADKLFIVMQPAQQREGRSFRTVRAEDIIEIRERQIRN